MPTNTYVALNKVTATGSVNTVTISSIPTTYTDLTIVVSGNLSGSANRASLAMRVGNGSPDSSSIYSNTQVSGNGTSAYSNRGTNETYCFTGVISEKIGTTVINIMNYANTTTYKTVLSRGNSLGQTATQDVGAFVNLWRSTSAINTIQFYVGDGTNFASGTTFSLYGIAAEGVSPAVKATGGAIYSDDTYYYHVFGSTGTFTPTQSLTADVLVVAGGGGGASRAGGGGGAGGVTYYASQSLSATGYTCTVGAGGAGGGGTTTGGNGSSGVNSQFGSLTASVGGGWGIRWLSAQNVGQAGSGGSGGGATMTANGTTSTPGSGTAGQGYAGGAQGDGGGGGGGAGAAGSVSTSPSGGAGGVGTSTYSSWGLATGVGQNVSGTYYIAGGGGGGYASSTGSGGTGGYGGGGNGSYTTTNNQPSGNGQVATGGGGGGAGNNNDSASVYGGNGGSGVVIVRYAKV